jgi:hypothetical protein
MRVLGPVDAAEDKKDFLDALNATLDKWWKVSNASTSDTSSPPFYSQGFDQVLLEKLLAVKLKTHGAVLHDSYTCDVFRSTSNRPFPTQRLSGPLFSSPGFPNFVGSNGQVLTLHEHGRCPQECRPREHQDWELC